MHIFSSVVEKYAYFSPIDLKYTKLQKKKRKFFLCGAHPLIVIDFSWGNINQEGVGKKYEFNI